MSLDLAFVTSTAEFSITITNPEYGLLLNEQFLKAPEGVLAAVFGAPQSGKSVRVSREELLSAACTLLDWMGQAKDKLPFAYMMEIPGRGSTITTGMQGGIRIDGAFYSLEARPGICELTRREILADGTGRVVGHIDVRGRKEIMTDNFGLIRIHRRKKPLAILRDLAKLKAFLGSQTDRSVKKELR